MARIHEQKRHDHLDVELMTSERQELEVRDPWHFINLRVNGTENLTPTELRALGLWLVNEGKRIGREYNSNGAPKANAGTA